jgi:hypothetical protein
VATSVREPNGRVSVTDGPFAETNEQILGFNEPIAKREGTEAQSADIPASHPVEDEAGTSVRCPSMREVI